MNLNIGYVIIREDVSPLPADNAFAGRGAIAWREQLHSAGERINP